MFDQNKRYPHQMNQQFSFIFFTVYPSTVYLISGITVTIYPWKSKQSISGITVTIYPGKSKQSPSIRLLTPKMINITTEQDLIHCVGANTIADLSKLTFKWSARLS